MRPWRQKLGAPLLVGSTVGTLLITYFGSGVCARYLGLIPGMLAASLLGAVFLLGAIFFIPPVEFSDRKTIRFRLLQFSNAIGLMLSKDAGRITSVIATP